MPDLTPEQETGVEWLVRNPEAWLGDVPGFGKTGQAIRAAMRLGAQRIAVACPAIARVNWEREAELWGCDLPVVRVTNTEEHIWPASPGPMLAICSYDGLVRSAKLRGAMNYHTWDVLICDEAHRLKSADANRTRAIYGNSFDARACLAGKAMCRWLLSASPMPNDAGELWTHLSALWPHLITGPQSGRVYTYDQFIERYCVLQFGEYGVPKIVGLRDRDGLLEILNRIMLRRTEIKGLPDLVLRENPTLVEVSDARLAELEQHPEIQELRSVLLSADARANDLAGVEDEYFHLATLRRLTGILKAKPTAELVAAELEAGDKMVLFAIHREVIDQLENYLTMAGIQCAVVHGGVPDGMRNTEIDRFNGDPACRVFLGQIEATKECVNLPSANRVRFVEQSWCPETNRQAIARVHRRGQLRQVFADAIAIAGSIDEVVQRVLTLKSINIQSLMEYHQNG